MTKEQFNDINIKLRAYRKKRDLTYENQKQEFLGNVFEKLSEYFKAYFIKIYIKDLKWY